MVNGKQAKKSKDKLNLIKRFIMGDNVINDILYNGIPRITGFRVVDPNDLSKLSTEQLKELNDINDEGQRSQRFKQMMRDNNKDGITWFESKSYDDNPSWFDDLANYQPSKEVFPDPEIEGVSYSNPANVPKINTHEEQQPSITSANEPQANLSIMELRALKNKQYLQQRLIEMAEQERLNLKERDQSIIWNKMQVL
jgi:hypothetical protein